ncbi:M23 family metallopeptidase [Protaetiibacter intestinalis]|uniref:M23 family metallopeptidase n=1 Tax=Protaetiibacter intestinalis TaxID=2419774 RepID=A0A387B705_9MICO|nr:M23 family metallopeptidase [Protaetiibacter intestinalis]AYF98127.1 M23 family metallopeptidase [Protaetiibacter intestinalis]
MTGTDHSLPPATTRRELRERERAAAEHVVAPAHVPVPAPAPSRPARPAPRRTLGRRLMSATALLFAGAFIVGTTLPTNALEVFAASDIDDPAQLAVASTVPGQVLEVDAEEAVDVEARDGFSVKSWAEVLREQYGTRNYSYSMSGWTGPVRWPFPYTVPISSGFGERVAPCRGCSTVHNAIDLTPGAGAPIYAIADGVVIRREPHGASWGNNLTIEHHINGHVVTSSYAHMQWDSSPIQLGDTVKVGDFLGLVGATGQATGAHLHLEIKVDGEYVDPLVWLKANAS